ncbi:terminase gpP N-terminus-related DNA-binding protein [Bacillus cereus]
MKKEKNRRLYERYQAILLHLKGYTNIQIAKIIGRSNVTIGTYVKRYQQARIAGEKPFPFLWSTCHYMNV